MDLPPNQWHKGSLNSSSGTAKSSNKKKHVMNVNTYKYHKHHHHHHHNHHNNPKKNKIIVKSSSINTSSRAKHTLLKRGILNNANTKININTVRQSRQNLKWVKQDSSISTSSSAPSSSSSHLNKSSIDLTLSLESELKSHDVFESTQRTKERLNVLHHLETLLCAWVKDVSKQRQEGGMIDNTVINNHAQIDRDNDNSSGSIPSVVKLVSFGSFRLGVHNHTSDLDLLAICPSYISREDFFTSLVEKLKQNESVKGLHSIPEAYTPVIKFTMDDLQIDLLYVSLVHGDHLLCDDVIDTINEDDVISHEDVNLNDEQESQSHPTSTSTSSACPEGTTCKQRKEFHLDDSMLIGLDEQSVRSLNGARVAQFLLDVIPNKKNFRIVLRAVKLWANVHGLYSNVLGFLGGINYAILTTWICTRNPNSSPAMLLKLFFQTFSRWLWPAHVSLTPIVKHPPKGVTTQLNVWDPQTNPRDRSHLMPIITPVYPSMNSSYNVNEPQLRRLRQELLHGDAILTKILEGKAEWSELFKANEFFKAHIHYIQINIISENATDHKSWFGFCESRLRLLIAGLESPPLGTFAYPCAKFFTRNEKPPTMKNVSIDGDEDDNENVGNVITSFFIALRFEKGIDAIELIDCIEEFVNIANNWENRKSSMDLTIEHVLQKDLPGYVRKDEDDDNDNDNDVHIETDAIGKK